MISNNYLLLVREQIEKFGSPSSREIVRRMSDAELKCDFLKHCKERWWAWRMQKPILPTIFTQALLSPRKKKFHFRSALRRRIGE